MPDEPLPTTYDAPVPDDDGEADPVPMYPIYPAPSPPMGFSSPAIAAFGVELYEAVPEQSLTQGLDAQYLETQALELPLTDAAQTDGNFVFVVQKDPNFPDDRHYTVFVGAERADALVILSVDLPSATASGNSQVGGSLGKSTLITP